MKSKNVVLADCVADEVRSLAENLRFEGEQFEIESYIANWKRTGKWSELKRYYTYFAVAFRIFMKRKKYHVIVGWQQFYALIFCFFCSVFRVKKSSVTIALNYTYKEKTGKLSKLYRRFMGKCMDPAYLDFIHVLSEEYAQIIHKQFNFPYERILVTPFGVNDEYEVLAKLPAPEKFENGGYALAIGRSNRDYDFLINAWKNIEFPLVIISDTYQGQISSSNITHLTNVAGDASYPWIANCAVMVIPIQDGTICSGDTVLLTAMSLERKIIVTTPSTLAEMYITDGENAVLTKKIPAEFEKTVQDVISSAQYDRLGTQARQYFLENYTRASMGKKLTHVLGAYIYR